MLSLNCAYVEQPQQGSGAGVEFGLLIALALVSVTTILLLQTLSVAL